MLYAQAEYERSRTGETALARAQSIGDMDIVAQAEHLFGHLEYAVGELGAARDRFAHSVDVFRALAIPWGIGHALSGMAEVALATGDTDQGGTSARRGRTGASFEPSLRCGAAALISQSFVKASHASGSSTTDFAFAYTLVPLAAAVVLKGDDAWAARILGAREAVIQRTGVAILYRRARPPRTDRTDGPRAPWPGPMVRDI